eukprot:6193013-Pleurochrysis_carterae.AAC.1
MVAASVVSLVSMWREGVDLHRFLAPSVFCGTLILLRKLFKYADHLAGCGWASSTRGSSQREAHAVLGVEAWPVHKMCVVCGARSASDSLGMALHRWIGCNGQLQRAGARHHGARYN